MNVNSTQLTPKRAAALNPARVFSGACPATPLWPMMGGRFMSCASKNVQSDGILTGCAGTNFFLLPSPLSFPCDLGGRTMATGQNNLDAPVKLERPLFTLLFQE